MEFKNLSLKMQIMVMGTIPKLERGETLTIVISSYTKLSVSEKQILTDYFTSNPVVPN